MAQAELLRVEDGPVIGRRALLGTFTAAGLVTAGPEPRAARPEAGDRLIAADGDPGRPLAPADLPAGGPPSLAWPLTAEGTVRDAARANQVLLVRLDPATLDEATAARAAAGVVAYGALCSHAGCVVKAWLSTEALLQCPCHNSRYDPRRAAAVVGGPAPRGLAALPLALAGGALVVAGPFVGRVGPASA